MSKLNSALGLGLGLVLSGSLLFTGCGDDDDSSSSSTSLAGVWSYVDAGVSEESVNLVSGGSLSVTSVDYEMEECIEFSGDWEAGDDSLRVNYTISGINQSESMAYELNGNSMTLTWEDGTSDTYTKASSHKTCDDFDFGSGTGGGFWTGSFSASIDGSSTSMITLAYGEIVDGEVIIFGSNGTSSINMILTENGTGSYEIPANAMAVYAPDMEDFATARYSNSGQITLSSLSETHMAGTFSFTATDAMGGNAVSITNGSFNITAP